jgi:hypothetical protein
MQATTKKGNDFMAVGLKFTERYSDCEEFMKWIFFFFLKVGHRARMIIE